MSTFANGWNLLSHMMRHIPLRYLPEEWIIKVTFRGYLGYFPNLRAPQTFNEKLQWLKLHDRDPRYSRMTDKLLVRDYVAETIGAEHLIPLLGVWDRPEEIDFDALPERFVLKCNHDSGSVLLCPDKASFDREKARRALKKALSRDYYWKTREYNYKGISRKILAEKLLKNEDGSELTDYKFYCFHGEPRIVQVDLARYSHHVKNYYSPEWDYIPVSRGGEKSDPAHRVEKPARLQEMLALCRKLSAGLPHVRVDLYCAEGGIYFSELTFHSGGGYNRMEPASYDALWGSYLELKDCDS